MGNPRQHRKARSSAHKVVKHSRHAKRNLRKMKPIRGPKELQDAWDKKKTVRQNYAAMGLMGSLKHADSGGSEIPFVSAAQTMSELSAKTKRVAKATDGTSVPQGFGRILRDADGHVTGVEIPEEEAVEDFGEKVSTDEDLAPKTALVQALEKLAETSRPVERFSSDGEIATLRKLVSTYGQDIEAMSKDRRLNEWQRTAGQLRRAIKKARLM